MKGGGRVGAEGGGGRRERVARGARGELTTKKKRASTCVDHHFFFFCLCMSGKRFTTILEGNAERVEVQGGLICEHCGLLKNSGVTLIRENIQIRIFSIWNAI